MATLLSGRYAITNSDLINDKATRNDPRKVFYEAMIESRTYEEYLSKVGSLHVEIAAYRKGPINGRMEILYARRNGWIRDGRT